MVTPEPTTVITVMTSLEFNVATGNGEGCLRISSGILWTVGEVFSLLLRGCLTPKWQARLWTGMLTSIA